MPFEEKENKVIFYEIPHKLTIGGVLLSVYGLSAAVFCLYTIYNSEKFSEFINAPLWAKILLCLLHLYLGLIPLLKYYMAVQTAILDYKLRVVFFETKRISETSVEEYEFAKIRRFQVEKDLDPDNPEGFYLEIEMKNGEKITVPNSFSVDIEPLKAIAQNVNKRLKS